MQHFVSSLAQKLAFSTDDFDKAPAAASAAILPKTIRRQVSRSSPGSGVLPASTDVQPTTIKTSTVRTPSASNKTRKPAAAPVDDEADAEEVSLTLTKPVEERVAFTQNIPRYSSRFQVEGARPGDSG